MVYNFNLGIGWASSGVEYAQAYRAKIFRKLGIKAKFFFMDMFPQENIEHMTANIGFRDEEVEWLYTYFSDCRISPVTYTLAQLEKSFAEEPVKKKREGKIVRYFWEQENTFYTAYLTNETEDYVHRVEMVCGGFLIRKDYYTYCRIYSEYYAPLDGKAHLYQRRFYQEDGTVCYEEILDGDSEIYKFSDRIFYNKAQLVGYLVETLQLTEEDTILIDRTTGIGQSILQNAGKAKKGIVIHADHFSENHTDEKKILWNNYYEYAFAQRKHVDFYITATNAQAELLQEQFQRYYGEQVKILVIPVGSLTELKYPTTDRKKYSLLTASRLAVEKHLDWVIEAVVKAREALPELTLDIYGRGGEEGFLKELIEKKHAGDYIRLCGQQDLTDVYQNYEAYISGSTSEGFGLTLLEASGAGCPIIGFDVRYGNQTFIDHDRNGYLLPVREDMEKKERVMLLTESIIRLFTEADLEAFHAHAYEKGADYLTEKVEEKWLEAVK